MKSMAEIILKRPDGSRSGFFGAQIRLTDSARKILNKSGGEHVEETKKTSADGMAIRSN